jgi:hypothetical protein
MSDKVPAPVNGHQYTSAEIVQILERAKALGVTFIKVQGFEATWGLEAPAPAPVDHTKPAPLSETGSPLQHQRGHDVGREERRTRELCPDCRSEKIMGKFGKPYCVQCYVDKKERSRR